MVSKDIGGLPMKRFLTLIAFLLIASGSVFAKTYSEYLSEAKSYEAQKKWCHVLGSYYDAMGTDGAPESKREAYEGHKKLVAAIESGKPGLGKFDRYTLHVEWMNLLKDAEKYGSTFCIYDSEVSDWEFLQNWLEYDEYAWEFDYETQTAIYDDEDEHECYKNALRNHTCPTSPSAPTSAHTITQVESSGKRFLPLGKAALVKNP